MITAMPRVAIAVTDFEKAVWTFVHQFGMPVDDLSKSSAPQLGARLAMCVPSRGSNIEIMSPADHDAPLARSLMRFLDRRGEGLFALMLEADDPNAEADRLAAQGLKVLPLMEGAGGRDIHPSSTHGVLIRIYPTGSFVKQMPETKHSMSLSGIVKVEIALRDLDAAVDVYVEKIGLTADPEIVDEARGVKSVVCHPPKGGAIELLSVHDAAKPFAANLAQTLADRGEGMYALVLQAPDVDLLTEQMANREVQLDSRNDAVAGVLVAPVCGARIRIEPQPR